MTNGHTTLKGTNFGLSRVFLDNDNMTLTYDIVQVEFNSSEGSGNFVHISTLT
jgi:hypothetical protein